jgi:Mg2+ and Co2+ transporter CorA
MLNSITQSDAEYTAAIAVDGKRDNIAMKTVAVLGVVFLPATFVATLFSIGMFDWGGADSGETSSLTVSPSMWIYWAVTVPLTAVTFSSWLLWSKRENHKSSKRLMMHRTKAPIESSGAATSKISRLFSSENMV